MTEYLLLLVSTVLINNFVLVKFLGLCPFMGVSGKLETAIGMGLATTFVMTLASACSYLMEHYILIPLDIAYLRTLGFILVMTGFLVQWPTLLTLAMYPVLVIMYLRLAKEEEREAVHEFGSRYLDYQASVPGFIPWRRR